MFVNVLSPLIREDRLLTRVTYACFPRRQPPTFSIRINDTDPIFYYCSAPGACTHDHMIGVINANATATLDDQRAYLANTTLQLSPGDPFPTEGPPPGVARPTQVPSSTSSSHPPATSTPTTPASAAGIDSTNSSNSLSGGAIAGIVIGAAAVLVLAGGLFYWCGQRSAAAAHHHYGGGAYPPHRGGGGGFADYWRSGPSHPAPGTGGVAYLNTGAGGSPPGQGGLVHQGSYPSDAGSGGEKAGGGAWVAHYSIQPPAATTGAETAEAAATPVAAVGGAGAGAGAAAAAVGMGMVNSSRRTPPVSPGLSSIGSFRGVVGGLASPEMGSIDGQTMAAGAGQQQQAL